jgi:hypothetical protein
MATRTKEKAPEGAGRLERLSRHWRNVLFLGSLAAEGFAFFAPSLAVLGAYGIAGAAGLEIVRGSSEKRRKTRR